MLTEGQACVAIVITDQLAPHPGIGLCRTVVLLKDQDIAFLAGAGMDEVIFIQKILKTVRDDFECGGHRGRMASGRGCRRRSSHTPKSRIKGHGGRKGSGR